MIINDTAKAAGTCYVWDVYEAVGTGAYTELSESVTDRAIGPSASFLESPWEVARYIYYTHSAKPAFDSDGIYSAAGAQRITVYRNAEDVSSFLGKYVYGGVGYDIAHNYAASMGPCKEMYHVTGASYTPGRSRIVISGTRYYTQAASYSQGVCANTVVRSGNINAYPENGEQGEKWYVRRQG